MSDERGAPVLLGGVAGTGKTRLGSLLSRHSRLSVTRKTYLWRDIYARHGDLSDPRNLSRCIDAALAVPGVQALNLDPAEVATRVAERPSTYAQVFDVIHGLHAEASGKARWCDQLGLVEAYAAPIFAELPGARFIHMVGDPRRSRPRRRMLGVSGWDVGKWLTSMELAERNSARFGDRYLVLRHEDLLTDEEATLRVVCGFLHEEVEEAMLALPPSSSSTPPPERSRRSGLLEWPVDRLALTAWRQIGERAIARQIRANA